MVKAAVMAGIVTECKINDLLMITEAEAAALYYWEQSKGSKLRNNTTFIICDAGGSTVNLTTFYVNVDRNTGEDIIYQIGDGESDNCGSSYLDKSFIQYIMRFYYNRELPLTYDMMMDLRVIINQFISEIKVKLYKYLIWLIHIFKQILVYNYYK
jgi:molecular chaperone DnaK (HSP70)